MLSKADFEIFLGKTVSVGLQHEIITNRLFFYNGVLTELSDDTLTLRMSNGFKIIPLDQVMDIHLDRRDK